jgi:hypothetical protein
MTDADELEVPMAWFWAEHLAVDLITPTGGLSLEYDCGFMAARVVLALTLLFTGIADHASDLSGDQLELIRDLISSGGPWLNWCDSRFDAADTPAPCLELARQAFRWLLLVSPTSKEQAEQSPGTGCRVGLKRAQRAVDTRLTCR